METIEHILIKAITMEVNDMKLAKSVWNEKSDLVISRLRTVCSQWSNILTTNFFRNELQRSFDAMKMVRLEILHQYPIVVPPNSFWIEQVISTMDQVFMIGQVHVDHRKSPYYTCNVYDRNNMREVKDVIPLPGQDTPSLVASSSETNCVHAICSDSWLHHGISILRIAKDDEHRFTASPLVTEMGMMPGHTLLETANGSLLFSKPCRCAQLTVIGIYNASGSLQHEIKLTSYILRLDKIIPRPNGNLVLVSANDNWEIKLTEIDMDGNVIRQYQSSIVAYRCDCDADKYGRIMIVENLNKIEFLDSEFNLLEFTGLQLDEDKLCRLGRLHYNRERNEFCEYRFRLPYDDTKGGIVTTFRPTK